MTRFRLVWLEIAEAQYHALAPEARMVIDQRLAALAQDPMRVKGAIYDRRSDQWSVPVAGGECLVYAVVTDPATLIVERVTRLAPARPRLPRALRSWAGRRWLWPRS
jgi:hypothetical protein